MSSSEVKTSTNGHHRITVAELQNSELYRCLVELDQRSVSEFVVHFYFRRWNWLTVGHYLLSLALLLAWVGVGVASGRGAQAIFASLLAGFFAFLVLIPLHEAVHGLAYRLIGARDVRFRLSLRELYAYVIAHNFVAGRKGFVWVAIAPFLVINVLLLALVFLLPEWRLHLLAALLLHTGGTSGDWALLSYLWENRAREVFTYDNAETGKSYFYERLGRG